MTGTADGFDSASRVVAGTAAVVSSTFTAVPNVSITGTAKVGSTLTAALSGAVPGGATAAYQWLRDDSYIDGGTASTYVAQPADFGKTITVQVLFSAPSMTSELRTSGPVIPAAGVFTAAPTPTLTGSVRVGGVVGVTTTGWPEGTTFTYGWRIVDAKGKVTTTTVKTPTYKPSAAQRGLKIIGVISGFVPGYGPVTKQTAASVISYGAFSAPAPTIVGSALVGGTLKLSIGTWTPKPSAYVIQWKRNGVAIAGAKWSSYKLTTSDYGKKITVTVTGTLTGYSARAVTSAATATVLYPFTRVYAPTISGYANVGERLTAKITAWTPTPTYSYQWNRDGIAIPGATASTYLLTTDDKGAKITVTLTGKRTGYYTRVVPSAATAIVGAPIIASGDFVQFQVGTDIAPGTYYSDGGPTCSFQRQGAGGFDEYLGGNLYEGNSFAGPRVITIAPTDTYFYSYFCGTWRLVKPALKTSVGDGTFAVGTQMSAGKWKAAYKDGCFVEFLGAFTGVGSADRTLAAPVYSSTATTITIPTTARGFTSNGCSTWTKVP